MINSPLSMTGSLFAKHLSCKKVSLSWRVKNALTTAYILGLLQNWLAKAFTALVGIPTITSTLSIRARISGEWVDFGVVCYRVITDLGVAFLVDDWDANTTDITNMNYHGCGTGTIAEAQTDSALGAESTTILNPDSARATGTKSQPTANQLRSIGTVNFDGGGAITEHGILSQAATGGGVLWDRSVFGAITVANGDSIGKLGRLAA